MSATPDVGEFLDFLRPVPLRPMMDRLQGITPERRLELDAEDKVKWDEIERLATQASDKLTDEEFGALQEWLLRDG